MFFGKMKALTFSYDDGVTQDRRLIEILDRYGLKATFNLNSGLLGTARALITEDGTTLAHVKPQASEIRSIYQGHEIAVHTVSHPQLSRLTEAEIIREVEEDRIRLSELAGYEVCGMAYPYGYPNDEDPTVAEIIRQHTGVRYARITRSTYCLDHPWQMYRFRPTAFHRAWGELDRLGREFLTMQPEQPVLFYIWGHSYELDLEDGWRKFEDFCRLISGREDVFYGTNREVFGL